MKGKCSNYFSNFMGMSTVFNKTFADVQTTYQKIAMTVPSSSAYVDYRWLANFPQMKRWIGPQNKSLNCLTINTPSSMKILQRRLKYVVTILKMTNWGFISHRLKVQHGLPSSYQDELIYELVNQSFTEKCYDGKPFISSQSPCWQRCGEQQKERKNSPLNL